MNKPTEVEKQSAVETVTTLAQRAQELFASGLRTRGELIRAMRAEQRPVSLTLLCEVCQLVIDTQAVTV